MIQSKDRIHPTILTDHTVDRYNRRLLRKLYIKKQTISLVSCSCPATVKPKEHHTLNPG